MDDPSFYGFPVWPEGALKAAQDVGGHRVTATNRGFDPTRRPPSAWRVPARRLPAAGAHDHSATCLTLTPDRDLALGPLPGHDRVLVALGAAHASSSPPWSAASWPDLASTTAPRSTSVRSPSSAPSPEPNYLV